MKKLVNTTLSLQIIFLVTIFSLIFFTQQDVSAILTSQAPTTIIGMADGTADEFSRGFSSPDGIAFDSSGNLWVSDNGNHRILRFSNPATNNQADLVIGQPGLYDDGLNFQNGGTTVNKIQEPSGITFDSSGNLWLADTANNRILRFSTPFTNLQGADLVLGESSFTGSDGAGCSTTGFDGQGPEHLTFDSSGNLWVSDTSNSRVLKFTTPFTNNQVASVVLGQTGFTSCNSNQGNESTTALDQMAGPRGLDFDSSGNLWVADSDNNRIIRFSTLTTGASADLVLGQSSNTAISSGTSNVKLKGPNALEFDSSGNLWVADESNSRILKFSTPFTNNDAATVVIGQANFDSSATSIAGAEGAKSLNAPNGMTFDGSGNLWVSDSNNNRVLQFTSFSSDEPTAAVVIGQIEFDDKTTESDASISKFSLKAPEDIEIDSSGNLWVADSANDRILRYSTPFTTFMAADLVIGQANFTIGSNGLTDSKLNTPTGIAFDGSGNLWVADKGNHRVLKFTTPFSNGQAATIVIGQGSSFTTANAPATPTQSSLNTPVDVAFDTSGNLWVTDSVNNRVLKYNSADISSNGPNAASAIGQSAYNAKGSDTTATTFDVPVYLAFDSSGNLWVSDENNDRVIRFDSPSSEFSEEADLVIGQASLTANTQTTDANNFRSPRGIDLDSSGNLAVVNGNSQRVTIFAAALTDGEDLASYIGQTGSNTESSADCGNGQVTLRCFDEPRGIKYDSSNNLWVVDRDNQRILLYKELGTTAVLASKSITQNSASSLTQAALVVGYTAPSNTQMGNTPTLVIQQTDTNPNSSSPDGTAVGKFYEVTSNTSGSLTSKTITITYTSAEITGLDASTLVIQRFSGGSWSELTTTVDTSAKTVTATTPGFSTFTVTGGAGSPSSSTGTGGGRVIGSPPQITDYMTSPTLVKFEDGSIGFGAFIQKEISLVNEMPTATIETGTPIALSYKIKNPNGADSFSYFAFYTNIRGDQSDIESSDTHVRYYKGKTLQVSDPKEFFSSANVTATKVDALNVIATFNVTFAKPMETSDVIVRIWDDRRQGYTSKFIDALRVIEPIPFLNSGNPFTVETTKEGVIAVRSLGDENKMWYLVNESWKETPEEDQSDETIRKKPTVKYVSLEKDGKEAYKEFRLDLNQRWINEKYSDKQVTITPSVLDREYNNWDDYKQVQVLLAEETMKKILDPTYKPNTSIQQLAYNNYGTTQNSLKSVQYEKNVDDESNTSIQQLVYNNQDTTQNSLKSVQYEKNVDDKPNKGLVGDDYVWYNYKKQRNLLEEQKAFEQNKVWLLGNNGTMEQISDETITKLEKGFYGKIDQSKIELLYDQPVQYVEPEVKEPISKILKRTHSHWDMYKKGQVMLAQTKVVDVTNYNFYETSPNIDQQKTFSSETIAPNFFWNENILPVTKGLDRTYDYWDTYKQGQVLLAESTLNEIDSKVNESNTNDELNETETWYQLKEEKRSNQLDREHNDWDNLKDKQVLKAEKKLFAMNNPSLAYENENAIAKKIYEMRNRVKCYNV